MPKAIMFVEAAFHDAEALYPYYRMQEAGYKVDIVAPVKGAVYTGKFGYPLTADLSPEDVKLDEYDVIIIPGGHAPDRMRLSTGLVTLVKEAHAKGKVVAGVCHGPQMLIEADLLRGRKVTCCKQLVTDVRNAGAVFVDAPAVSDGKLVSSRTPADLPDFCKEILRILEKA
ncbi:MAG: type 1 glutamine amidotransferase [Acidaminococcales bacterium]|jgi:protease I|nr:type 1 glutamine amidotransferase [Acidaminococcales bacterium]